MRYLVVLDKNSPVGQMYAADGGNDGLSEPGRHPILDCTEIDLDSPYYIRANHSLARVGGRSQTLFLPHGSVVLVLRYEEADGVPLGFRPA